MRFAECHDSSGLSQIRARAQIDRLAQEFLQRADENSLVFRAVRQEDSVFQQCARQLPRQLRLVPPMIRAGHVEDGDDIRPLWWLA